MFTASHSVIVQCYVVTSHKHDGRGEGGLQAAAEEPGGVRGEDIVMMMIIIMISAVND